MADVSQIKLPNGSVYDLIDEKSGYITADYIENKTDYEIPVSRVGEIVVGETTIGTDSTNFPTSKAVVDYVDERVVQEIDAIDVGVTSVNGKTGSVTLSASDVGAITHSDLNNELGDFENHMQGQIPTSTSQLTNDSGFITSDSDEKVRTWDDATNNTYALMLTSNSNSPSVQHRDWYNLYYYRTIGDKKARLYVGGSSSSGILLLGNANSTKTQLMGSSTANRTITLPDATGTVALTSDIPTIPTNISAFTNDSGYLTASDIASVLTYKGTKASYSALPSSGNSTGDVWHITDTGAEYAWDGSAWQELGTAIDLSNYLTTSDIADWAKQSSKPTYTAAEVGALPASTTIPTKTSDLTNDSGFITSYTDEKVKSTTWSGDTFYIVGTTSSSTSTGTLNKHDSFKVFVSNDSSTDGLTQLSLGNSTAANTAGAKYGEILIYSNYVYCVKLRAGANTQPGLTGNRTIYLPDKTGTIALTSDIPDTSSFLTSETDPVFSASAAAGITSTDISNWNGKSSTDEKLKVTYNTTTGSFYPVLTQTSGLAETKKQDSYFRFDRNNGNVELCIGGNGSINGILRLFTTTTGGWVQLSTQATSNRAIVLPNKDGTVALTSDIPQVYSSTNTGGYLTMATLPIYDGTVE